MEVLTGEIDHRYIAGLLAVVAIILHFWVVILLLQPSDAEKKPIPMKIMEVALLTEPRPKVETMPSAPPKPALPPPKKVQPPKPLPKKKEIKPPVKQKETVIHKEGEIEKPKIVTKEAITAPPVLTNPFAKTDAPVSKPQAQAAKKPATNASDGGNSNKGSNSGVKLLVKVEPTFPARALSRHIEGWVKVEFTVTPSGTVSDASVVGASPSGIFEEAALNNIKKWKFKPKISNGNPVSQRAVQVIAFKLLK